MDVQSASIGAPDMNPASQAKQAELAQQEKVQAVQSEAPKQEQAAGLAPGVGQNLNVTV